MTTYADTVEFPEELYNYGLDEALLKTVFRQVESGRGSLKWCLHGIPSKSFYKNLHQFLKKWPMTQCTTKVAIGQFYLAIDKNLQEKGGRPDNVYRFIDRIQVSDPDELMVYANLAELKAMQAEVKHCTNHVSDLTCQVSELKFQLEESRKQLESAKCALCDVTNEKMKLQRQKDMVEKKAIRLQKLQFSLEEDISHLLDENTDLLMAITEVEEELVSESRLSEMEVAGMSEFCIQTKHGRRYSPAIRKLYYQLLADQVPTSKIADIIKAVIRCFNPSVDIQNLKLPQRACASYMRKSELKTISDAHKAKVLSEKASETGYRLNTDGTTKAQKKIGAVAINDMVVSVNELPDGTAASAVHDVSRELQTLREIAHALKMPNADTINWTLLVSSTSDSASTQKRFNKLIEECRDNDEKKYGPATSKTIDLVENFCSMHLGINLRKAFLSGLVQENTSSSDRQHYQVDILVHEFCKVFGRHGVPEYGSGVLAFQDFLAIMSTDSSLST